MSAQINHDDYECPPLSQWEQHKVDRLLHDIGLAEEPRETPRQEPRTAPFKPLTDDDRRAVTILCTIGVCVVAFALAVWLGRVPLADWMLQ